MNIAIVSGDFLHLPAFQKRGGAQRARYAIGIQLVALVFLRAAQHPQWPPTPGGHGSASLAPVPRRS